MKRKEAGIVSDGIARYWRGWSLLLGECVRWSAIWKDDGIGGPLHGAQPTMPEAVTAAHEAARNGRSGL